MKLQKLNLENFKGKTGSFEFTEETNIFGENATGKTTLFDAYLWLITGKDHQDRQDFEIKTLDENNKYKHRLPHSVEGVFDGIKLKRLYQEKWTKRRGEENETFDGHITKYWIDDVPKTQKEYNETLDVIIPSSIFRLITNPYHFNSISWTERRKIVFEIAGKPNIEDIIAKDKSFEQLKEINIENEKVKTKAGIKKLKDQLKDIPTRIDEVKKGMPEAVDGEKIKADIVEVEKERDNIADQIADKHKAVEEKNKGYYDLKKQLMEVEGEINSKKQENYNKEQEKYQERYNKAWEDYQETLKELNNKKSERDEIERKNVSLRNQYQENEDQLHKLREDYGKVDAEQYQASEEDKVCPTCGREFDSSKIEELKEKFNQQKAERLKSIQKTGTELKEHNEKILKEVKDLPSIQQYQDEAENKRQEFENVKLEKPAEPEVDKELLEKKTDLEKQIAEYEVIGVDTEELEQKKKELTEMVKELEKQLSVNREREKDLKRIKELETEQKKLSSELAGLEKTEFLIDKFTRTEISMMEERVEKAFGVKFKMFNELINGGFEETCEVLIDGVPFSNANKAAQINTGIKIINTLINHYEKSATIFIDNAEAVNRLEPTESQIVRMYVVELPDYKKKEVISEYESKGILLQ